MATRTQVVMVDDLDGQEISANGKTVTFAHGGTSYEIDLAESNARKLREALAPYISAARRVGGRPSSAGSPNKSELRAMRTWAKAQGIKVSERGRVSQQVQDAYYAAH